MVLKEGKDINNFPKESIPEPNRKLCWQLSSCGHIYTLKGADTLAGESPSENSTHGEAASLPVPSALVRRGVVSLNKKAFIPGSEWPGQGGVLAEALSPIPFQTPGKENKNTLA